MKIYVAGLALFCAVSGAEAAEIRIQLTGVLTEQTAGVDPEWLDLPTYQPAPYALSVGDTVEFKGRIDSSRVVDFGNGYSVAYFYDSAPENFSLTVNGYSWLPQDEWLDGDTDFTGILDFSGTLPQLAAPSLLLKDGKVLGFAGWLIPSSRPVPLFELGSEYMTGFYDPDDGGWNLPDPEFLAVSALFELTADPFMYENLYFGNSYNGVWDFEGSWVGVPEPQSWAMMVGGFGLLGIALRRRRVAGAETG